MECLNAVRVLEAGMYADMAGLGVAYLLDDGDLKAIVAWVRRVARRRS